MKKTVITVLAAGLLAVPAQSEAAETHVYDLKVGQQDYKAEIKHDIYGFDVNNRRSVSIPAGQEVIVTEHRLWDGFNYLILEGNIAIAAKDSDVTINSMSDTKLNYGGYKVSNITQELLENSKDRKYYEDYKKYLLDNDKYYYRWDQGKLATRAKILYGYDGAITEEAFLFNSYTEWKADGKPVPTMKPEPQRIDVLSDSFKQTYMNSKSFTVLNHKPGEKVQAVIKDFRTGKQMVTDNGAMWYGRNAGYTTNAKLQVKSLFVMPYKTVTYDQFIQKYGAPTSEKLKTDGRIEHQLIYDKKQGDGYKVKVVFSSNKGNLKYIYKIKE